MATPRYLTADDDDIDLLDEDLSQEREEKMQSKALDARIRRINSKVHRYVNITFNEMGVAGATDTANLLSGLNYINREDESDVAGWERFVQMLFSEHLQSARILYARMHRELDRGHGSISPIDVAEWEAFYRSPAHEYKHKESQIEHTLPREIDQSIEIRLERDELLRKAEARSLSASYALRDDSSFLSMSLARRRSAVAAFREDVRELSEEMSAAHSHLRSQLITAAGGEKAVISLDEAYRWLGRVFDRANNAKDVETLVRSDITPFLAKAEQVRANYNEADGVLDTLASHLPPSFPRRARASFLTLPLEGRQAYVESMRIAARAASLARQAEEAEAKAATASEHAIKACLAAGDWRGAQVHLETLIALDPRHTSIKTLIDAVDEAEAEGEKAEAVAESRRQLETSLKIVGHSSLSAAYGAALSAGAEQFAAFTAQVEHRVEMEKVPTLAPTLKREEPTRARQSEALLVSEKEDETETDQPETKVVEAEEGESVVKTVETLADKEEKGKKAGLALKADGDAISISRQAETAKIHPWLKHHLGVLTRHGASFRPEAKPAA